MKNDYQRIPEMYGRYLEKWRAKAGESRQSIGMAVIEQLELCGLWAYLHEFDIPKPSTGDMSSDATQFAQNLWRWCGLSSETKASPQKLNHLKDCIERAMPDDIRGACVSERIGRNAIAAVAVVKGSGGSLIGSLKLANKEVSEAVTAAMDCLQNTSPTVVEAALKEIREAQASLNDVEASINNLSEIQ